MNGRAGACGRCRGLLEGLDELLHALPVLKAAGVALPAGGVELSVHDLSCERRKLPAHWKRQRVPLVVLRTGPELIDGDLVTREPVEAVPPPRGPRASAL